MDQKYQHPMRDFVTASARADSVRESHAWQQSEIHSAGPELQASNMDALKNQNYGPHNQIWKNMIQKTVLRGV